MRGRPPKYTTPEERAEARRQASRTYRAKKNKELKDALKRVKDLEKELELLRQLPSIRSNSTRRLSRPDRWE
jgi:hypothetical protein